MSSEWLETCCFLVETNLPFLWRWCDLLNADNLFMCLFFLLKKDDYIFGSSCWKIEQKNISWKSNQIWLRLVAQVCSTKTSATWTPCQKWHFSLVSAFPHVAALCFSILFWVVGQKTWRRDGAGSSTFVRMLTTEAAAHIKKPSPPPSPLQLVSPGTRQITKRAKHTSVLATIQRAERQQRDTQGADICVLTLPVVALTEHFMVRSDTPPGPVNLADGYYI